MFLHAKHVQENINERKFAQAMKSIKHMRVRQMKQTVEDINKH